MLVTVLLCLALCCLPDQAFAWGAGTHLQLGVTVLNNLPAIAPAAAAAIGAFPHDFLYGCIAADITIGKKFTHYLLHCHRWQVGRKVLQAAWPHPQQQACAYGYLAHLAADTVAHSYYVPLQVMGSFPTLTLKHAYWEMRFDSAVEQEVWDLGKKVAVENYLANDGLLRRVLSDTIFSFGTNKRIFNSILLVSRLEKWQQVLQTINDTSRFPLADVDREEFLGLAREAVLDYLAEGEESRFYRADPTGERALAAAEAVRKNLRLLYRSGKISKADAFDQLAEMRNKLKDAICQPELLLRILSTE
jgi:hypothetical protein